MGHAHGGGRAKEIRSYTEERVRLASDGSWAGRVEPRAGLLKLAEAMLPAHRAYAPELYEEMESMAAVTGLSLAEAVIVGGFTDVVDVVRSRAGINVEEDDCTAVMVPADEPADGALLAQTWDMHDSATEHTIMFDLRPALFPRALVFSTVGCLGQIGMNEAGIAVGINNLSAMEGRIGVTWPYIVRRALQMTSLEDALTCVTGAERAGAHNYLLLDQTGRGYNIEAMPHCCVVRDLEDLPLVHTNHCLEKETRGVEAQRPADLLNSSIARLRRAEELLALWQGRGTPEKLMQLLRDREVICRISSPPHHMESSGAVVMRPTTGELWAVRGLPIENKFEHFEFGDQAVTR